MSAVDCGHSGLTWEVWVNIDGLLLEAAAMSCKDDTREHLIVCMLHAAEATTNTAHRFSRQILLDPFAKVIASTDGLYDITRAAVTCRPLEPYKGGGAVALEVLREGHGSELLCREGVEWARAVPVVPRFVADAA